MANLQKDRYDSKNDYFYRKNYMVAGFVSQNLPSVCNAALLNSLHPTNTYTTCTLVTQNDRGKWFAPRTSRNGNSKNIHIFTMFPKIIRIIEVKAKISTFVNMNSL